MQYGVRARAGGLLLSAEKKANEKTATTSVSVLRKQLYSSKCRRHVLLSATKLNVSSNMRSDRGCVHNLVMVVHRSGLHEQIKVVGQQCHTLVLHFLRVCKKSKLASQAQLRAALQKSRCIVNRQAQPAISENKTEIILQQRRQSK